MPTKCPTCHVENPEDKPFCADCGTKLGMSSETVSSVTKTLDLPTQGLEKGSVFAGRYEIIEQLGEGGMGQVYRAHDTQIEEDIAIKVLRPEIALDKRILERFRNELKFARKITHKSVCRMHDISVSDGTTYISMEYLKGRDLKSLIQKKEKLPAEEAVSIAIQVCEGLVEAHRLGVVHRDLKPQNIMIDKDGQAKIMDFGIARSLEAPGVTQTGVIIGTPDYISPEQAEGQEADERADIYSLGVILYEMVTGSVPFKGDTALSVALKHKAQLPLDPRKRNAEIPDDLSRLILICMEKDRARRYQSAKDLLDDLRNIEQGFPLGTKIRPHRATTLSRLLHKRWFTPAVIILAAAIIGLILWRVLPSRSPALTPFSGKPTLAVLHFQNKTGDATLDSWRITLPYLLITDLYQSKLLDVVPDDRITEILSELDLVETENYTTSNLEDIAGKAEVSHILKGMLIRSGESFRIDTTLQETSTMRIVSAARVEGQGDEDFPTMVDELTLKIKADLDFAEDQIATDIDEEVGAITTKSPEALKLYREGRKYHFSDPEKSIELMKKAIAIDPEFAMAYRSLSTCLFNIGDGKQSTEYGRKALELIDRISLRERLHILATMEVNLEKKRALAEELLRIYPDDVQMIENLGTFYLQREFYEEAAETYELLVQKKIGRPHDTLAFIYLALGEYEKAEKIAEIYKKEVAKKDVYLNSLAWAYVVQGKRDLAFSELSKKEELPKNPRILKWLGWLYVALGDETEAEKIFRKVFDLENKASHFEGWMNLADLACLQGKFKKAYELWAEGMKLAEKMENRGWIATFRVQAALLDWTRGDIDRAFEAMMNHKLSDPWLRVLVFTARKEFEKAQQVADRIKEQIETNPFGLQKRVTRFHAMLQGHISMEKGDYEEAISYFQKAQSLTAFPLPDNMAEYPWPFDALALAYYRSGNLEKAEQEYEKISRMTLGRVVSWDFYAKSFYMLGKISEQRGWPGKAIEHYEKFLEVWKDADPDIPEVEDAKKRLEQMKN